MLGHVVLAMLVVICMERVEEGTVSQNSWPDHTGRPDYELAKKSTKTKAKGLRPNGKEDLEAHGCGLAIEDTLCEDNISWIGTQTTNIGHHGNANIFLDWEWARIKWPYITKIIEAFGGEDGCKSLAQGKRHNLNNNNGNINGGI